MSRVTENHLAVAGLAPWRHSQPPTTTSWPSAFASALKAMPSSATMALTRSTRPSFSSSDERKERRKHTDHGRLLLPRTPATAAHL